MGDAWTNPSVYTYVRDCQDSDHKPVVALLKRNIGGGTEKPPLLRQYSRRSSLVAVGQAILGAAISAVSVADYSDDGSFNLSPADWDGNGVAGDMDGDGTLDMTDVAIVATATVAVAAVATQAWNRAKDRWSRWCATAPAVAVGVVTWNMGGAKVTGESMECILNALRQKMRKEGQGAHERPDCLIVGLQEFVKLNPKNGLLFMSGWQFAKLKDDTANAVLDVLNGTGGTGTADDGSREGYELLAREDMYGLYLMIFKKQSVDLSLCAQATTTSNLCGSKGGVAIRMQVPCCALLRLWSQLAATFRLSSACGLSSLPPSRCCPPSLAPPSHLPIFARPRLDLAPSASQARDSMSITAINMHLPSGEEINVCGVT